MQFTSLYFALGGLFLASAAPAPQSFAVRAPLSTQDTLYVTFWEKGCGQQSDTGSSATNYITTTDGASNRPEDCVINLHYGWQSVEIRQPFDTNVKYSVDFFSGEGCNNPILAGATEARCYSQPNGQMVQTFRAHLL